MHQVIIVLNNSQTNILQSFKDKEDALTAMSKIEEVMNDAVSGKESLLSFPDDYGHLCHIVGSSVTCALLIDVHLENDSNIDKEILRLRAQNKLQRLVASDPVLKLTTGGIQ